MRGRVDVHIDKLKVSSSVFLPIDKNKVKLLAKEMLERFDPSLCVLTVIPVDIETLDHEKLEDNLYEVVHGRHRFLALEQLKRDDKLKLLSFMEEEEITCQVLYYAGACNANYANIRGNDMNSRFARQPDHHDIVQMIRGFVREGFDPQTITTIVNRYATLLKFPDSLKLALKTVCSWPDTSVQLLVKIIDKFERFETKDADKVLLDRSRKKIERGEKLVLPVIQFKELVKLPEPRFREAADKILTGQISVKKLVEDYREEKVRKAKEAKIEEAAGNVGIEKLRESFPERFTQEIIDKLPTKAGPGQAGKDQAIVKYTSSVTSRVKDPSLELKVIDLEEDKDEISCLLRYVKRPRVRASLENLDKLTDTELATLYCSSDDTYCFKVD